SQVISSFDTVSGVYYTDGNSLGMNFSLNTESASAAKEIGKAANSIISLYSLSSSSGIGQALSNLKINRNAATVTMSYKTSVDQLVSTLESLNETFGSFG
ncbi:MAG: hypothetical protein SV760_05895, partial [Halobacteria archaeon]|nr:hypothetical protein [Halobacteria archaeon]